MIQLLRTCARTSINSTARAYYQPQARALLSQRKPFFTAVATRKAFSTTTIHANKQQNTANLEEQQKQKNKVEQQQQKVQVNGGKTPIGKVQQEKLLISFTCKQCSTRSSHVMSKQAYTGGTVLIECPGCHNRHLIADHLKIFSDDRINIEDILKAKGELVSTDSNDIQFDELPESIKKKLRGEK